MAKIVNPDGTVTDTSGNFGSGFYLPEVKEEIFGAFGDIENQSENEDGNTFGVYQLQSQPIPKDADLRFYGTRVLPSLEFVKLLQTGEREYDPNIPSDQMLFGNYQIPAQQRPSGVMTPEEVAQQALEDTISAVGVQVGGNIGRAFGDPLVKEGDALSRGFMSAIGQDTLPTDAISNYDLNNFDRTAFRLGKINETRLGTGNKPLIYAPSLASKTAAKLSGQEDLFEKIAPSRSLVGIEKVGDTRENIFAYEPDASSANLKGTNVDAIELENQVDAGGLVGSTTARLADSRFQMQGVGAGVADFALGLIQGKDAGEAAKTAIGTGLGTYIGSAIGGPIGAVVGGSIGRAISGRVICNELFRQNLMSAKDVLIDLEFTQKRLTKQHINGYHAWAIGVVKGLRKGKFVKLWKHIAQHRCNEIKYLLGKADKPDYLGKIYRKIFEPMCYIIGYFKKETDYTVLYTGEKNGT